MDYRYLLVTVENGVGIITFHRPDDLNALNSAVLSELDKAVDQMAEDRSVRVGVFTGEGKKMCIRDSLYPVHPLISEYSC